MDERRIRFEAEVMPHLDAAFRYARWLSHSRADADDAVQEAVLRAFRGFAGMRGTDAKAWLLTIVRNCHYTACAQRRRRSLVPIPEDHEARDLEAITDATPGPEHEAIRRDERRRLARLLAALPEEQREILVLRELEDLDYRQIAGIAGIPVGTVMSRLARARAALRARWRDDGAEGASHDLP